MLADRFTKPPALHDSMLDSGMFFQRKVREMETENIRHYYIQSCATWPDDSISIRAANNVDCVMLTVRDHGKIACIDLSPDSAREFAAQMIVAADLAAK